MLRRIYFLVPTVAAAKAIVDELLLDRMKAGTIDGRVVMTL